MTTAAETMLEDAMLDLEDAELLALMGDSGRAFEIRSAAAFEVGRRRGVERDRQHSALHGGRPLRYGRVEARPGYRGRTVCLDCYYGTPPKEMPR